MPHTYHFTRTSGNQKTGPIPVTISSSSTCPKTCPFKGNGCYADYGPLAMHWRAVDAGERGGTLEQLCAQIKALPAGQLWRWAQAGDLPGNGKTISYPALAKVTRANRGKRGFGYTHYDVSIPANAVAVQHAIAAGFTINLSANDLAHADELAALGIAPVVVVLPIEATQAVRTPAGRLVIVCPAVTTEGMDCARCGICSKPDRQAIVGFPAHGSGQKRVQAVFFQRTDGTVTRDVTARRGSTRAAAVL